MNTILTTGILIFSLTTIRWCHMMQSRSGVPIPTTVSMLIVASMGAVCVAWGAL